MDSRFLPPRASFIEVVSVGSTLKASAMQFAAISSCSASSEGTEPSVCAVWRKSRIASARRFLDWSVAYNILLEGDWRGGGEHTIVAMCVREGY